MTDIRAIVTGGAGFIGSHLCESLVQRNIHVTIWDNLFRGKYENIVAILDENNRFVMLDLADSKNIGRMADCFENEQPSLIFHYAAINGTQYFYDFPSRVLEVNTLATHNLLCALRIARERTPDFECKLIYASSSEVYGEPVSLPSKETDITYFDVTQDRDCYAASKLTGELFFRLSAEDLGLRYYVLRLFNAYGPRMVGSNYGQVIPEFIQRLNAGEYPLKIFGNGKHMRSFCYIDDCVAMTMALALSDAPAGIYNVGGNSEISILELARKIMHIMDLEPCFTFLEERKGDHLRRCPDLTKIRGIIDATCHTTLDDGLAKLLHR